MTQVGTSRNNLPFPSLLLQNDALVRALKGYFKRTFAWDPNKDSILAGVMTLKQAGIILMTGSGFQVAPIQHVLCREFLPVVGGGRSPPSLAIEGIAREDPSGTPPMPRITLRFAGF